MLDNARGGRQGPTPPARDDTLIIVVGDQHASRQASSAPTTTSARGERLRDKARRLLPRPKISRTIPKPDARRLSALRRRVAAARLRVSRASRIIVPRASPISRGPSKPTEAKDKQAVANEAYLHAAGDAHAGQNLPLHPSRRACTRPDDVVLTAMGPGPPSCFRGRIDNTGRVPRDGPPLSASAPGASQLVKRRKNTVSLEPWRRIIEAEEAGLGRVGLGEERIAAVGGDEGGGSDLRRWRASPAK